MSKAQKFYMMGVVTFWGALIYALVWGLILFTTNNSATYNVAFGSFSMTINRWFDVILFPLYLNLILSVYLWLLPVLEKHGVNHDDLVAGLVIGLVAGLVIGLVYGLVIGLVAGLVYGLVYGLGVGLVIGLVAGLVYGLVYGLVVLARVIVGLHKRAFDKTK